MPFTKGDPNINRKGRPPKEWTMAGIIEQALEEVEAKSGKTFKELIAKRLAHLAVSGDMQAIKEINDRMDGKPAQSVKHQGDKDNPASFTFIVQSDVAKENLKQLYEGSDSTND